MTGQFEAQIRAFVDKALDKADVVVAETVQEVFHRVVARSPVDTGFFRASWAYQAGAPARSMVTVNTGSSESPMAPPGGVIVSLPALDTVHYISNSLPYALRLEYGYSDKAPQGMVGITLAEIETIIAEAIAR